MNRVGVHRVKNPSRKRYVQAVVNQQPNVYVNQKRRIKRRNIEYRTPTDSIGTGKECRSSKGRQFD